MTAALACYFAHRSVTRNPPKQMNHNIFARFVSLEVRLYRIAWFCKCFYPALATFTCCSNDYYSFTYHDAHNSQPRPFLTVIHWKHVPPYLCEIKWGNEWLKQLKSIGDGSISPNTNWLSFFSLFKINRKAQRSVRHCFGQMMRHRDTIA